MPNETRIDPTRRHQMFPALTDAEIARIKRFGIVHRYPRGARLFAAGEPGPGMFVVLKGLVSITQRDGLGRVVPIAQQGPGQFLAEVAQLSGGYALVDGYADDDVETLLVPPEQLRALIIAEAAIDDARVAYEVGSLPIGAKELLNTLISSFNVTRQSWLTYRGAIATNVAPDIYFDELTENLKDLTRAIRAFHERMRMQTRQGAAIN